MIWTPAKLHIASVNATKPKPPGHVVSLTLTGGGWVDGIEIFVVHSSVTAARLIAAIQHSKDKEDIAIAENIEVASHDVSCDADMSGKRAGSYDVIATQVDGGALQVAVKVAAFDWR